ncbi:hypothetical protein N9J26_00285 [bacterium]|nr:hypothetical protein [bacterium]
MLHMDEKAQPHQIVTLSIFIVTLKRSQDGISTSQEDAKAGDRQIAG